MAIMQNPQQGNSVPPMRPPSGAVNQPQSPGPAPQGQSPEAGGNPLVQLLSQLMQAISALVEAIVSSKAPDPVKQEAQSLLAHFKQFAGMLTGDQQQQQPDAPKTNVQVGTQGTRVSTPEQGGGNSTPAL